MIVYLWSAGTAEGVTDSPRKARRHAAAWMGRQKADTALIEQAHFIPGIESMEAGYTRTPRDPYWAGRRHPSGRISWRLCVRAPELAASCRKKAPRAALSSQLDHATDKADGGVPVAPAMTATPPSAAEQGADSMSPAYLVPAGHGRQASQAPGAVAATYLDGLVGGRRIRLGSRTSPMAMTQARQVATLLTALMPGLEVTVSGIQTDADQWAGDLAALGGKGAFTKTIDRVLLLGEIDAAVHCMKDVPGDVPLPPGLVFAAYLLREDIRDCLVFPFSSGRAALADLPAGARIGTSSVRRKAQLGRYRPDVAVYRVRGNVNSRLVRLDAGEFDALVLARAGLARIGMDGRAVETFDTDIMCPAVGAGVIGIQCRTDDKGLLELLRLLDDADTRTNIVAERTMLHGLQGHCNSPIAGHCGTTSDGQLALRGMVFTRDGGEFVHAMEWGPADRPAELGAYLAGVLLRKGARDLIMGIPH